MSLRQLRVKAMEFAITRYSRMTKSQLLSAIRSAQASTVDSGVITPSPQEREKSASAKFHAGGVENGGHLAVVDEALADLPEGYGASRIVLLPRDPQWAYTYWDVPNEDKEAKRQQGGQQLALRLYDVTDINFNHQPAHSIQEYPCDELAREWYIPIPVSDRSYVVEIGYRTHDGRWLNLARSAAITVPPTYPSDWIEDAFISVPFDMNLHGKTLYQLQEPQKQAAGGVGVVAYQGREPQPLGQSRPTVSQLQWSVDASLVAGSLHIQAYPDQSVSAFLSPSGVGFMQPWMASGSGLGLHMGSSERLPRRSLPLHLELETELVMHGSTEPGAQVTVSGRPVQLNPDGSFHLYMNVPDGDLTLHVSAIAADGGARQDLTLWMQRQTLPQRHSPADPSTSDLPQDSI
jgi:hypothetical protein